MSDKISLKKNNFYYSPLIKTVKLHIKYPFSLQTLIVSLNFFSTVNKVISMTYTIIKANFNQASLLNLRVAVVST